MKELNLHSDLEGSNPTFSHDTATHDSVLPYKIQLQMIMWFR